MTIRFMSQNSTHQVTRHRVTGLLQESPAVAELNLSPEVLAEVAARYCVGG